MKLENTYVKKVPFLVAKSTREQPLDETAAEKLIAPPTCFIPCQVQRNALSPESSVYYNMTGKTTLARYLSTVQFNAGALKVLLRQMAQMLDFCTQAHLPLKNVMLDYDYSYFDAQQRSLAFIYLPFGGIDSDIRSINAFFGGLSSHVLCRDNEAKRLMVEYSSYFQFNPYLNIMDFKKNLTALIETGHMLRQPRSPQAAAPAAQVAGGRGAQTVPPQASRQAASGRQVQMKSVAAARPVPQTPANPAKPLSSRDAMTTVLGGAPAAATAPAATAPQTPTTPAQRPAAATPAPQAPAAPSTVQRVGGTAPKAKQQSSITSKTQKIPATARKKPVVGGSSAKPAGGKPDAKASQGATAKPAQQKVSSRAKSTVAPTGDVSYYLVGIGAGNRVDLTKAEFTIGKSSRCDYQVQGNDAVSRVHATFSIAPDGCYIADQESLNKTFVDDKQIEPFTKVKLSDGDRIKLGNAEFKFHVSSEQGR